MAGIDSEHVIELLNGSPGWRGFENHTQFMPARTNSNQMERRLVRSRASLLPNPRSEANGFFNGIERNSLAAPAAANATGSNAATHWPRFPGVGQRNTSPVL